MKILLFGTSNYDISAVESSGDINDSKPWVAKLVVKNCGLQYIIYIKESYT